MKKINNIPGDVTKIYNVLSLSLNEIGLQARVDLMSNCRVLTGNLRRSHAFKVVKNSVVLGVTPNAKYAPFVEFKPTDAGGRPWFRKTLQNNKTVYMKIIEKHLRGVEK